MMSKHAPWSLQVNAEAVERLTQQEAIQCSHLIDRSEGEMENSAALIDQQVGRVCLVCDVRRVRNVRV